VLSWKISNTANTRYCLDAVQGDGKVREIFNSDQGSQFTSRPWSLEVSWRVALDAGLSDTTTGARNRASVRGDRVRSTGRGRS
jgi:transposase InsO family protein